MSFWTLFRLRLLSLILLAPELAAFAGLLLNGSWALVVYPVVVAVVGFRVFRSRSLSRPTS